MTAYILSALLDLHRHPRIPIRRESNGLNVILENPEETIFRVDLLMTIEKAYQQGLISSAQVKLINEFLSGYPIEGVASKEEELTAALQALATLSIDYTDDVFIARYKDKYNITEDDFRAKLEALSNNFSAIQEVDNNYGMEYNLS